MNEHKRIKDMLVDFAEGRLSEDAAEVVREHLQHCRQCSGQAARLRVLAEGVGEISKISADVEACESAQTALFEAIDSEQAGVLGKAGSRWRANARSRVMKLAAAAAVVIVMLGGITFWPSGDSNGGQWWLGPPAVWGQTIIAQLEKVEAIVYRRQFVFVGGHGQTHVSGTWNKIYQTLGKERTDRYYESSDEDTFGDSSPNSVLQESTWVTPDGPNMVTYNVSFEYKCYNLQVDEGGAAYLSDPLEAGLHDPMRKLQDFVKLMDKAERILEPAVFDGRQCVGFEVKAGDDDGVNRRVDRIWFDVETMLPVRIEEHGMSITGSSGSTITMIKDQFEYYARVPAELFTPKIPEGFIEGKEDDVRKARERSEKGALPYADVPAGLRTEIVAALEGVETASYRERSGSMIDGRWGLSDGDRFYIRGQSWREDSYAGGEPVRMRWFVPEKSDSGDTSFDFNDKQFQLIETIVNPVEKSYEIVKHPSQSHPDNPMDWIVFLADQLDRADSFVPSEQVDGVECVGFVLSAAKYGTNPPTSINRMWFDARTKLPVKLEFEWLQGDGLRKKVQDEFQWDGAVDPSMLTPVIPADFKPAGDGK